MRMSLLTTTAALALLASASGSNALEPPLDVFLRGLAPDNIQSSLRVVGGQSTNPDKWPWQIYLIVPAKGDFVGLCGGSLIAPRWVLTAAHCFNEWNKTGQLIMVEGLKSIDPKSIDKWVFKRAYKSTKVFFDNYDKKTQTNDIALIQLPEASTSDPVPMQLVPEPTLEKAGRMTTITGWGRLHSVKQGANGAMTDSQTGARLTDADVQPKTLMKVDVPLVGIPECQTAYTGGDGVIDQRNLCAGYKQGGKDSCQGDSGGPMVTQAADGSYRQIGVVSWGAGCAAPGYPGIYTRVSSFTGWLKQTMGKDLIVAETVPVPDPAPVVANNPPPEPAPVKPAAAPVKPAAAPDATVDDNPSAGDGGANAPPASSEPPVENNPAGVAVEIDGGDDLKIGQKISFKVTTKKAGFVTLLDRGPDDSLTMVFPNDFSLRSPTGAKASGTVTPERPLIVPDGRNPYAGFEYVIDPPAGEGMLVAILSDGPITPDDLADKGPKSFTTRIAAKAFIERLGGALRTSVKPRSDGAPEKPNFSITFHPYKIAQ